MALSLTRPLLFGFATLIGLAAGSGGFTFVYGRGWSYLTNDPSACVNCHVMRPQFEAWQRGPHRRAAGCNDCHTPHDVVGKYLTKAANGFWHSFYFTTGRFPEPIRAGARNREITERRCRECHAGIVQMMAVGHRGGEPRSCLRCHRDVGHRH